MRQWHPSRVVVAVLGLAGLAYLATAQPSEEPDKLRAPPALVYTWTAPTSGTPVSYYVVEVKINEEIFRQPDPVTQTTFTLTDVEFLQEYQIRVAGVDADGNMGPFSPWSDSFSPELEAPEF